MSTKVGKNKLIIKWNRVDGLFSCTIQFTTGMPQATILEPLLFTFMQMIFCEFCQFAILAGGKMNKYFCIVCDWLILNQLSLNLLRTVFITFVSNFASVPKHDDIRF